MSIAAFPGEMAIAAGLELLGVIWQDLTPEQKEKLAAWFIEDIEKARDFFTPEEPTP
jgi:hypothetical protein